MSDNVLVRPPMPRRTGRAIDWQSGDSDRASAPGVYREGYNRLAGVGQGQSPPALVDSLVQRQSTGGAPSDRKPRQTDWRG